MKAEFQTLLSHAHEKLRAAKLLLDGRAWSDAASRAYYAAFHAVSAALLSLGETYSTHGQTIGAFNKKFIHNGTFPTEFTALLTRMFEDRQTADYDSIDFISEEEARQDVEDAERLVTTIEEFLGNLD